ncbi:urease accessory protein UreD [Rothia halotolerans]|uniref:urease accessory protein UreD n=1 Tax=Rothia halotolerans TaxID=405770 RepID=UPI00101BC395|nr:urease accessory protein UreD [Rothia halotolerans]
MEVDAGPRGRPRIARLVPGDFLAARPLPPEGDLARVALIGRQMTLLSGDELRIRIRLRPGARLELVEPAALVAYDSAGEPSRWECDVELAEGARLTWDGAPCIAARGSALTRCLRTELAEGARALISETLVLGRAGEEGSSLRSLVQVSLAGAPLLVEDLRTGGSLRRSPAVLAGHRVMASALALGYRPPAVPGTPPAGSTTLSLAAPGAVFRWLGGRHHEGRAALAEVLPAWRRAALGQ